MIGGRYRLVEMIGAGGMGRVWRGRDELLEREVAVKEIELPSAMRPEERELFVKRALREARSAARLNHPGLVTVHDVTTHQDTPVIVMEFLQGHSLAEVLADQGRLPVAEVARIGSAMAQALLEAHVAGVVHRDLKPANVMLTGQRVVITDFGIARVADEPALTQSGALVGTPAFMCPEQAKGEPVTPAGDLWSLGATLYAAVEGRPPYPGPTAVAVLSALLTQDPPTPVQAGPLTPVLMGLLRRDPSDRLPAEAVVAALTSNTQGPGTAPDVVRVRSPRLHGQGSARPFGKVIAAVVLALAAAVAVVLWQPGGEFGSSLGEIPTGKGGDVQSVAVSEYWDQRIALVADKESLTFWDLVAEESLTISHIPPARGLITSLAAAGTLAVAGFFDGTVAVWDVPSQREVIAVEGQTGAARAVALGEVNGRTVVLSGGADKTIYVRDAKSGDVLYKLTGQLGEINALAVIDVDGTPVAVSLDGANVLRLWDLAVGRQLASPLAKEVGTGLATGFLDGIPVAITSDLRVWDLRKRSLIRQIENIGDTSGGAVAISSLGGRPVVVSVVFPKTGDNTSDDGVQVWDLRTGRPLGSYLGTNYGPDAMAVTSVGDRMVLVAEQMDVVSLWSLGPPYPE